MAADGIEAYPSRQDRIVVEFGDGFAIQAQGFPDGDAIVAEYGEGNDVEWIARKHGITVERVYEVVQRTVDGDPRPPTGPASSW